HFVDEGKLSAEGIRNALGQKMAEEILGLLAPVAPALKLRDSKGERAVKASDIYVLTRSEKEGRELAQWLRAAGIPVAFFKQDGLFQSDEAQDIRELLQAIAEPDDRSARLRAWGGPFFGLSLEELARTRELPPSHPLLFRLAAWKALADARDYERLFSRILEDSGVVRRELFLGASERRLTNYLHLFELLLEEVGRSRCALPELVRALQAYIEGRRSPPNESGNVQRLEGERDAVQFMTMHKSKGLEAPIVFLGGGFTAAPTGDVVVFHQDGQRVAWLGKPDGELAPLVDQERRADDERLLYVALTRAAARLYLPYFAELSDAERQALGEQPDAKLSGAFGYLKGGYAVLNARLQSMVGAGEAGPEQGFVRTFVPCGALAPASAPEEALAAWRPPPELLEEAPVDTRVGELRRRHAGFVVTSYSRMSAAAKSAVTSDEDVEELKADREGEWPVLAADELPGGVATGLFLHEVLEKVDVKPVCEAESLEAWAPGVETLLQRAARRQGIEPRYLPHARRLAWNALRTPLALWGGQRLTGIAHADKLLREVEFLYPIPEASHPRLGGSAPVGARYGIERGCVRGFIDLVFEHQGRVYFADWKSDLLPRFDAASVGEHVRAHYAIQEQLYTLAVVRMLGIATEAEYEARFGGSLYCFLRGMGQEEGAGLYLGRASWAQARAWEEALLRNTEWGLPLAG
ncbi:MAG TPA: 3'-5' exonuclease, partial [Aggregicoccus sp.]|nr:3'-5' exonuclease [Aggregicoccus sp.]